MNTFKESLISAFEQTYNRAFDPKYPLNSFLSGFINFSFREGFQTKYKYLGKMSRSAMNSVYPPLSDNSYGLLMEWNRNQKLNNSGRLVVYNEKNVYNWIEWGLFLPFRVGKNIAKLGTEFIWNLAFDGLNQLSEYLKDRADEALSDGEEEDSTRHQSYRQRFTYFGLKSLGYLVQVLSWAPWLVAKLGQSITSPFAAMKESFHYVMSHSKKKSFALFCLAVLAAGFRGLISLAAYSLIVSVAFPALALPLFTSGKLGAQIVLGLGKAINWLATSLPFTTTIGSAIVSSSLGVSLGLTSASAALAGTTAVLTSVLAGLKVLLRWLSHLSPKPTAIPLANCNEDSVINSSNTNNQVITSLNNSTHMHSGPAVTFTPAPENYVHQQQQNQQYSYPQLSMHVINPTPPVSPSASTRENRTQQLADCPSFSRRNSSLYKRRLTRLTNDSDETYDTNFSLPNSSI